PRRAGPLSPRVLDERPLLVLAKGDAQLRLRVHHDGAVPRDRLPERSAADEEEADRALLSRDRDRVAGPVQHHGAVSAHARPLHVEVALAHVLARVRVTLRVEIALALEAVREARVPRLHRMPEAAPSRDRPAAAPGSRHDRTPPAALARALA